jgi:hypothetical protein
MGLQAYALMAGAEDAVCASAHIPGEGWKPYEAPASSTSRQSAQAQMAAFGALHHGVRSRLRFRLQRRWNTGGEHKAAADAATGWRHET